MSYESMITFALAIFIFGITPGPGVFALISNSLSNGMKSSIALGVGMAVSDVVYLILAFYGLVSLAKNYAGVFDFISIVGGLYLIYLGYKIFTAPIDTNVKKVKKSYRSYFGNFSKGFLISASNPKVIIFYIAFLPTFVDLSTLSSNDMVIISVITFFALMCGLSLISYSAHRARQLLTKESSVKKLNSNRWFYYGLGWGLLVG